MDIRNFFKPLNKKKEDPPKKRVLAVGSDSDEDPLPKKSRKQNRIIDSDSDNESPLPIITKKKSSAKKKDATLKETTASDFFGSSKPERSEKGVTKKDQKTSGSSERKRGHSDESYNEESPLPSKKKVKKESKEHEKTPTKKKATPSPEKKENVDNNIPKSKKNHSPKKEKVHKTPKKSNTPVKSSRKEESGNSHENKKHRTPSKQEKHGTSVQGEEKVSPKEKKSSPSMKSEKHATPSKLDKPSKPKDNQIHDKEKTEHSSKPQKKEKAKTTKGGKNQRSYELEVTKPEQKVENASKLDESMESKGTPSHKAAMYKKYLQRSGPKNPGSKPVPEGTPTCLSGLTFVITGVMESLDRTEMSEIIKERGGRVTTSVSKNTSYIILGEEPGQSKTSKGEQLGTKFIDEDEFLELLKTRGAEQGTSDKAGSSAVKDSKKIGQSKKSTPKKEKSSPKIDLTPSSSSPSAKASNLSQATVGSTKSPAPSSSASTCSPADSSDSLWVDKYKPKNLKSIIGQQGDASNAKKLLNWLRNWHQNQSGKVKLVKPSPWAKDNTGAYFKAALLSGPPGVGKTTTVNLVCKELGFSTMETNASDTRSKKSLQQDISELLSNKSLSGFRKGEKTSPNHVLVMDEVDGMAGNEDRGGMAELIALIKSSKIPIICMCNDRNSPKIRSLANHCFDLRYSKPRVEQIRGAMLSVCYKEGIKIRPEALDEMIVGSNQDVRQVLNHLSVWSANKKQLDNDQMHKDSESSKKDLKMGPWDVCTKVFSESAHRNMSIHDKTSLFFHDFSIGPLFIQENYPKVLPHSARGNPHKLMKQIALTASSLADGDIVDKNIRSRQAWSLLPTQALYSSVLPGDYMEGHMTSQIEFPKWLGNNSREKKFDRLSQELHTHMILRISGTKRDVASDYSKALKDMVVGPLSKRGADGVQTAVDAMVAHDLVREDLESILELSSWSGAKEAMAQVESKVKAAFTRAINKSGHLNPYGAGNISKKKGVSNDLEEGEQESEEEEDDDITKDAMIVKGKKGSASSKKTASAPKKSTEKSKKSKK